MISPHRAWPGALAAALLWAAPPGRADTTGAPPPSALRQAFETAWARQPEARSAAWRRDAATAMAEAAARWTPEPPALEVAAKSDRPTGNHGVREYDATLAVPLWWPGERARARSAASAASGAVEARLRAAQWRLAAEVREAHWAVERARMDEAVAARRLVNAEQIAADVGRRVRAGDLARADANQADSAVARARSAVAEAAAQFAQAAGAWTSLTGQAPASGAAEPSPAGAGPDIHPALGDLSAQAELARRQRDLAGTRSRANPELTVGAVRERDAFGERYGQSVVIGIRVPLGVSSDSGARIATASADLLEAEGELERQTERLRAQAAVARLRVEALEAARAAADSHAALAEDARGYFDKSFRLGQTDLPTRLRIELEAAEAERQAARSRIEAAAAVSELRQALGLLPE